MAAELNSSFIPRWLRTAFIHLREGSEKPALLRYSAATFWVGLAFGLRFALTSSIGDRVPFSFFVTTALISAWCGGAGPGFYALALGMLLGDWFFLPPVRAFGQFGAVEWALLLTNVIPAAIGIVLIETLHRHRRLLRADSTALREQVERCNALEKQVEIARAQVVDYATSLESAVSQRTSELNEAVRCMETFCYSIAHDLRAPVRAMIGFTYAMAESCSPGSAAREHSERVLAAAKRMDRLVTDLLEYGKLSHVPLRLANVSIASVGAETMALLRNDIDRSKACIRMVEPMPPVWTDPDLLLQVFMQLITNALRFPRAGAPLEVAISAEELPGSIRICVSDNGRGIPKEYQPKIFGVFETLEPRSNQHTGIGLAIVAKIVERLQGQVAVKSEPDKGATFLIDLPKTRRALTVLTRPDQAMTVRRESSSEPPARAALDEQPSEAA